MTANWISLVCGQNKIFEDVTLGFGKQWSRLLTHIHTLTHTYSQSRLIIATCSIHQKRELLLSTSSCESMGKTLSVCVCLCVCNLSLAIICQQQTTRISYLWSHVMGPLSLPLSPSHSLFFCTVTISIVQKYRPCWPFPYLCYFISACSQSGWYGDHFVVWDVGKRMEGAFVPPWEQAWGNGPLRFTQTHTHSHSVYIYTYIYIERERIARRHRFVRLWVI